MMSDLEIGNDAAPAVSDDNVGQPIPTVSKNVTDYDEERQQQQNQNHEAAKGTIHK